MIWVDNALVALLAIYTICGLARGYNQELFSLVVWVVGGIVAWSFSQDFAVLLLSVVKTPSTRMIASFVSLIVITLMLGWIINLLLSGTRKTGGLSIMERLGGLLLGPIHGAIVASVLVLLAGLTPLPKDRWWHESKFLPPFQSLAVFVKDHIPSKLASSINYH